jgi:hypothetical protein
MEARGSRSSHKELALLVLLLHGATGYRVTRLAAMDIQRPLTHSNNLLLTTVRLERVTVVIGLLSQPGPRVVSSATHITNPIS